MTRPLDSLTEALLTAAARAGADAADALAVDGTSLSIDIRAGKLEQAERSESIELGLRVLVGRRQACVSVSDISDATITAVAERAVAMAREAPEDPCVGLADPAQLARDWDVAALELADDAPEPSAAALEEDARRAEAAAMAVPGITQVEASAGYGRRAMHLAPVERLSRAAMPAPRAPSRPWPSPARARGWSGTGPPKAAPSRPTCPRPTRSGRLAAERALQRLGARKPRTGAYPVLL